MNRREILASIKTARQPYYVYVLARPDSQPFYVGIGTGRRIGDHAIQAMRQNLDSHKLRVIRKLWKDGSEISYTIHAWFDDRADAASAEACLIASIGRRDTRTGPLTNCTDGGEGAPNPSSEVKSRRSAKLKEGWAAGQRSAAHLHSPEVSARAAASRLGKKRGPYQWKNKPGPKEAGRQRLSEMLKADPVSRRPGVAAKISAALRLRAL